MRADDHEFIRILKGHVRDVVPKYMPWDAGKEDAGDGDRGEFRGYIGQQHPNHTGMSGRTKAAIEVLFWPAGYEHATQVVLSRLQSANYKHLAIVKPVQAAIRR